MPSGRFGVIIRSKLVTPAFAVLRSLQHYIFIMKWFPQNISVEKILFFIFLYTQLMKSISGIIFFVMVFLK
jgi:hypothetical protein